GVAGILDMKSGRLDRRVISEIGADQPAIPRPSILGIAGRVNADKAAASADELLEGSLLVRVENVSGRAEEDDDPVSREFGCRKTAGVLGGVDAETVLGAQRLDGGNSVGNRVVTKAGRFREHEDGKSRRR